MMILVSVALLALSVQAPTQTGSTTLPANTTTAPAAKQQAPQSNTATYTDQELGLAFDHPKGWKQSKVRIKNKTKFDLTDPKSWRPAKYDNTTRFLMPLPGVAEKGTVEIFAGQFNSEPEIWQTSQRDINVQLN